MEEHNKSNAQLKNDTEPKVIDLTPEMELPDQDNSDIIDLTKAIDSPDALTAPKLSVPASENDIDAQPAPEPAPSQAPDDRMHIEQEVDAAFDAVQAPEDELPGTANTTKPLFDQLSGITQQVDRVLDDSADGVVTPDRQESMAPEDNLAAGAADFDAEMAIAEDDEENGRPHRKGGSRYTVHRRGGNCGVDRHRRPDEIQADAARQEEDDEILELTDIVEPDEVQADAAQQEEDDEVLELTDIVQPDEVQADAARQEEDDEVLELTDIVQPDEVQADAAWQEEDNEILELTDIVQPA